MRHSSGSSFTYFLQLLVLDPEKRIPLDDIQRHPWILKHCMKDDRVKSNSASSKDGRP